MSDKKDYFSVLGLSPAFDLDGRALHKAYLQEQRKHHPDQLAKSGSDADKLASMQHSSQVNQAYQVLKNPLTRAEYLLSLEGVKVGGESSAVQASPMLLMESMELREQLEEAAFTEDVQALEIQTRAIQEESIQNFATHFEAKNLADAAQATIRCRYAEKFLLELKAKMAALRAKQA